MELERREAVSKAEERSNTSPEAVSRRTFLRVGGTGIAAAALALVMPGSLSLADAKARRRRRPRRPRKPAPVSAPAPAPTPAPPPAPAPAPSEPVPSGPLALGVFVPGLPWTFRDTDEFSSMVGREQGIINWFQDWVMDFDPAYMDAAVARNGMPMVTWEPWRFGGGLGQSEYALRTILAGDHDAYIRRWAQAAAAWGKPFYLRFAHEMNGDWTTWSPGIVGNTSAEFVAAWRKVHDIFREEGATNVRWLWCPVAHYEGATPYGGLYPGDAYVDWVGMNGYNWGNTRSWSHWQSFSEIFGPSYAILTSMTEKPVMVPEMGCTELGGDKAAWIRSTFLREVPRSFPKLKALAWFQANKENDWRVNSSPASLEAYKEVVADAGYQGNLP